MSKRVCLRILVKRQNFILLRHALYALNASRRRDARSAKMLTNNFASGQTGDS